MEAEYGYILTLKPRFIKALGIFRKLCIYLHYVRAPTNLAGNDTKLNWSPQNFMISKPKTLSRIH